MHERDASFLALPTQDSRAQVGRGKPQTIRPHAPVVDVCLPAFTRLRVNESRIHILPKQPPLDWNNVLGRRANTAPPKKDVLFSDPPKNSASTLTQVGKSDESKTFSPRPVGGNVVTSHEGTAPSLGVSDDTAPGKSGSNSRQGAGEKSAKDETQLSSVPCSRLKEETTAEGDLRLPETIPVSPRYRNSAMASSLPTLNLKGCLVSDRKTEQHQQLTPSSSHSLPISITSENVAITARYDKQTARSMMHDMLPAFSRTHSNTSSNPVPHDKTMSFSPKSPTLPESPSFLFMRTTLMGETPPSNISTSAVAPPSAFFGYNDGQLVDNVKKKKRTTLGTPIKRAYASIVRIFGGEKSSQNAASVDVSATCSGSPSRSTIQRTKKKKKGKKRNIKNKENAPNTLRMDQSGKNSLEAVSVSTMKHETPPGTTTAATTVGGDSTLPSMRNSLCGNSPAIKCMIPMPPSFFLLEDDVVESATAAISTSTSSQEKVTSSITLDKGGGTDLEGVSAAPDTPQTPGTTSTGSSGTKGGDENSATAMAAFSANGNLNLSLLSLEPTLVAFENNTTITTNANLRNTLHDTSNVDAGGSVRVLPPEKPKPLCRISFSSAGSGGTEPSKALNKPKLANDPKNSIGTSPAYSRSSEKKREKTFNQQEQQLKQIPRLSAIEEQVRSCTNLLSVTNNNMPSNMPIADDEKRGVVQQKKGKTVETERMNEKMVTSSSPRPTSTVGQNGMSMENLFPHNLSNNVSTDSNNASPRGADWPTDTFSTQLPLAGSTPCLSGDTSTKDVQLGTLSQYAHRREADLSRSTFASIGACLAVSQTLRVINLKGCMIDEEGLRGLAEIPTLKVVCVSHIRQLKSLRSLIECRNGRFAEIEEIDAQCTAIQNEGIVGLEKMRRLRRLCLNMTCVTDVTRLSASRSLEELSLTSTPVTSEGIFGLEKIPTLKKLNISRTKVQSLPRLYKSGSLEKLILYSCKVTNEDLRRLAQMPRLEVLDVSTTKVTDLSTLRGNLSLKSLTAQWLQLINCEDILFDRQSSRNGEAHAKSRRKDGTHSKKNSCTPTYLSNYPIENDAEAGFCGLADIPTLEHVDLSHCAIHSVKSLFVSKSIKSLVLRRTRVDSNGIKGIGSMRSLQTLVISNVADSFLAEDASEWSSASGVLVSITELPNVLNLSVLDLSFTDVYDLRMLSALPLLRELRLVETLITVDGIRGIEKLPSLHTLDISQTSVTSLQFLSSGCQSLKRLFVRANRNTRGFCIGNLHTLHSLELLDVSDTVVEDIKMLFRLSCHLRQLIWRWGERRDVRGLIEPLPCWVNTLVLKGIESMPFLELLDITNTAVSSVSFLAQSTSLRWLKLSRCKALDNDGIVGLQSIRTLEELDLSHATGITDVSCLATSPTLRGLRLGWTGVTLEGLHGIKTIPTLTSLDITSAPAECEMKGEEKGNTVVTTDGGKNSHLNRNTPCTVNPLLGGIAGHVLLGKRQSRRVSFIL
ncbi:hypothetical protein ECC02_003318 [Trypanosoma cruzi]|uniref:Leucine-rich repeat protein (LRRP) n=1 Tax=Trypanosoma cruzi TaxID=5693 RepID=A0A7J6YAZ8_TRYCR|nr:hypothetical protein ECC02_003318 [Trypanosoma cruzi]